MNKYIFYLAIFWGSFWSSVLYAQVSIQDQDQVFLIQSIRQGQWKVQRADSKKSIKIRVPLRWRLNAQSHWKAHTYSLNKMIEIHEWVESSSNPPRVLLWIRDARKTDWELFWAGERDPLGDYMVVEKVKGKLALSQHFKIPHLSKCMPFSDWLSTKTYDFKQKKFKSLDMRWSPIEKALAFKKLSAADWSKRSLWSRGFHHYWIASQPASLKTKILGDGKLNAALTLKGEDWLLIEAYGNMPIDSLILYSPEVLTQPVTIYWSGKKTVLRHLGKKGVEISFSKPYPYCVVLKNDGPSKWSEIAPVLKYDALPNTEALFEAILKIDDRKQRTLLFKILLKWEKNYFALVKRYMNTHEIDLSMLHRLLEGAQGLPKPKQKAVAALILSAPMSIKDHELMAKIFDLLKSSPQKAMKHYAKYLENFVPSSDEYLEIAQWMARLPVRNARAPLFKALKQRAHGHHYERVTETLIAIGPKVLPEIEKFIRDPKLSEDALKALLKVILSLPKGKKLKFGTLVNGLKRDRPSVQVLKMEVLGYYQVQGIQDKLMDLYENSDVDIVRAEALKLMIHINESSFEAMDYWYQQGLSDASPTVRLVAAIGLEQAQARKPLAQKWITIIKERVEVEPWPEIQGHLLEIALKAGEWEWVKEQVEKLKKKPKDPVAQAVASKLLERWPKAKPTQNNAVQDQEIKPFE